MTPVVVAVLLLAGCGGESRTTPSSDAGTTTAAATATAPASAAPLPARWYADSDDNGIPNFIELEIGKDPAVDDCTQRRCRLPRGTSTAQAARGRATVIALDASGSMAAPAGGGMTKMAAAKRAIRSYVRNTPPALDRFGFVVFGHRGDNSAAGRRASCRGVETLAPVGGFDGGKVVRVLAAFEPTGWTPLAAALTEAGRSFRAGAREVARILLVTDGLETCGGNPVAAATRLQRGGVHVVVDVVGLDVDAAKAKRLRAVAAATGGRYVDARTTAALISRFQRFAGEQTRLASQLICLAAHGARATICRAGMRDAATIAMNTKANALRVDGDETAAKEVDRFVGDLRDRADDDIAAGNAALEGRAAKVRRELERIARQRG
jgi:Mg-chelatase subunit ChlD